METSARLKEIAESQTLAISARAAELRAAGRDVISLAAGEPDVGTPTAICDAGVDAIRSGKTRYTPSAGTPEVRAAVAAALERDHGLRYGAGEICITAGAKPALYLSLVALLERNDSVVIPAPYWVSYPPLVQLAGGTPHILETTEETGFVPSTAQLEEALQRPSVKGIILNSPSNPTGSVWPTERIEALVELCEKYDRWILSDEIYAQISFLDDPVTSPAALSKAGRARSIVVNGVSKSYSMTGWRLGWVAGPENLLAAVKKAQSQLIGNACSISQAAATEALRLETLEQVRTMVASFRERRDYLVPALQSLDGFTLYPPQGAFYAFPGVAELCKRHNCDDVGLCKLLLEEVEIATVPGAAFGKGGHIRLSFAASLENLQRAITRLRNWLSAS